MRHLSTQSRANIYASDAIPTKRDDDGIACFYRLDLANAYEAGFAAAQKVDEPATITSHPQYDTQQAAKEYLYGEYTLYGKMSMDRVKFSDADMEHAFKAGSDWQRDKLVPMFKEKQKTLTELFFEIQATTNTSTIGSYDVFYQVQDLLEAANIKLYGIPLHPDKLRAFMLDLRKKGFPAPVDLDHEPPQSIRSLIISEFQKVGELLTKLQDDVRYAYDQPPTINEADPFTASASKLTDEELFAEIKRRTADGKLTAHVPRTIDEIFKPDGVPGEGEV